LFTSSAAIRGLNFLLVLLTEIQKGWPSFGDQVDESVSLTTNVGNLSATNENPGFVIPNQIAHLLKLLLIS
jgi:hypothetical protein